MRSLFRRFQKLLTSSGTPLNTIHIQQANLLHNLSVLQALHPEQTVFPVLKSNAYGHGLKEVCQILRTAPWIVYLCVDSYPERQIVRDYTPHQALVIGETLPENYRLYDLGRTAFAVYNTATINQLWSLGRLCRIHLFVNTGMNREGIDEHQLEEMLILLKQYPLLRIEGVMSHFSVADAPDQDNNAYTDKQLALYHRLYAQITDAGHTPIWRHIANSAGYAHVQDPLFTAARTGYAFYGYNPFEPEDACFSAYKALTPALRVTSTIISVHQLSAPAYVGYGNTYTTAWSTTLCTLPFGYMEGLPRAASNQAVIKRRNQYLQAAGRISMNLSTFDAHQFPIQPGDEVELISSTSTDPNSISALAASAQTIPYELLVKLDRGIRRVVG